MSRALAAIRADIDEVNRRLVDLISERGRLAREAGALKRLESAPPVDEERERAMVDGVLRLNPGPFSDDALEAMFRAILVHCRQLVIDLSSR